MSFHFLFIPFERFDYKSDFLVQGSCPCKSSDIIDAVNSKMIDTLSICEMHNHADDYLNIGKCLSLTVVDTSIVMSTAIIHKPNAISKIQHGVLTGFSIKFDPEQRHIIEIAIIDAPTFQDDEDISAQQEIEIGNDICREINSFTSLDQFERHLESFLNKEIRSGRLEKKKVDCIGNIQIEIRSDEHAPPHFHVCVDGIDASFSIEDGSLLRGRLNSSQTKKVRLWYKQSRQKLIEVWNNTRPGNCPVGPIRYK